MLSPSHRETVLVRCTRMTFHGSACLHHLNACVNIRHIRSRKHRSVWKNVLGCTNFFKANFLRWKSNQATTKSVRKLPQLLFISSFFFIYFLLLFPSTPSLLTQPAHNGAQCFPTHLLKGIQTPGNLLFLGSIPYAWI